LVPMGGGPNAQQAVQLLPALIALGSVPQVRFCQVFAPSHIVADTPILDQAVHHLRRQIQTRNKTSPRVPVLATHIRGSSVSEAVIKLAQADECDVVVLGASREGLLQQVMQGNIPEAIARGCQCTVILVRCAL
jgi:CIC family chloride channel protein